MSVLGFIDVLECGPQPNILISRPFINRRHFIRSWKINILYQVTGKSIQEKWLENPKQALSNKYFMGQEKKPLKNSYFMVPKEMGPLSGYPKLTHLQSLFKSLWPKHNYSLCFLLTFFIYLNILFHPSEFI